MKRIAKFGLLGITLMLGITLVACKDEEKASPTTNEVSSTVIEPSTTSQPSETSSANVSGYTNPEEIPGDYTLVDMSRVRSSRRLSSIGLDTSNAKLEYNIGDKFDPSGIKVSATYITSTWNEEKGDYDRKVDEEEKTTGFYYDTSLVNFDDSGTYPVTCVYREESSIVKSTFKIIVRYSKLVESGVQYNAGLEISHDNTLLTNYSVYLNDTFVMPSVSYFKHIYVGREEVSRKTVVSKAVTVDSSAVDTSKEGNYLVKLTYPSTVEINGVEVDNTVYAFFIVSVINPVVGVEWSSGDLSLEATPGKLDTSSWKISLTKTVAGTNEIVDYSDDLFTLEGVDQYNPGTYTATITLKSNKSFQLEKEITIVESTKYDMIRYMDFGQLLPEGYIDTDGNQTATAAAGAIDSTGVFLSDGSSVIEEHKPAADKFVGGNYTFTARYKLSGAGSATSKNLGIKVDGPCQVTLYFATGSEGVERIMRLLNANGDVVEEATTTSYRAYTYTITEAGTYYFASASSGMNIYGAIVSYEKGAN